MAPWNVIKKIGSGIDQCLQLACANPIISLELLFVGVVAAIFPQFCMTVFMSPVVIYSAMLLTALLRIGHRQHQEKLSRKKKPAVTHNGADSAEADHDDSINEVSEVTMKFGEQRITEALSTEEPVGEGKIWDAVEMKDDDELLHGKSMHREIVITEDAMMYRSHLDVIMEDIEGENGTPLKQSDDDDDGYIDPSEVDEEDRGKVHLDDFFSHTLPSSWKSFHNYNSSDDMESSSESSVDNGSLGDLGPLVYEIHDQSDGFGEQSRDQQDMDEEELRDENLFEIVHVGDVHSASEDDNLIEIALSGDQEIMNPPEEAVALIDPGFTERKADHDQIQMGGNSCHTEEGNLIEIDLSASADNLHAMPSIEMESDDDHKILNLAESTFVEETQCSKQTELSSSYENHENHGEIHRPEMTEIGDAATPPPSKPPLGSEAP